MHAAQGRHIILIDPEFGPNSSPHTNAWLAQRGRDEYEEFHLALTSSLEDEAKSERNIRMVHVCDDHFRLDDRLIHCTLSEARSLLRRPLKILVEHAHNDGAFVRRMLPADWSNKLKRWERESWAEFSNGGGLGTLKETIQHLDSLEAQRIVAIFDSDAVTPGTPSQTSELAVVVCKNRAVAGLRLRRRAAENYLPPATLGEWSQETSPKYQHKRRARVFAQLTQEQRHHYSMRDGLQKDADSAGRLPVLFESLPPSDRETLWKGFGDIRSLFVRDEFFSETRLGTDDVFGEREAIRALIFANL